MLGPEKVLAQKKILGPKQVLLLETFWYKKIGQNNLWVKKNVKSKQHYALQKILYSKKIVGPKKY